MPVSKKIPAGSKQRPIKKAVKKTVIKKVITSNSLFSKKDKQANDMLGKATLMSQAEPSPK